MVNSISFGSEYKFPTSDISHLKEAAIYELADYCEDKGMPRRDTVCKCNEGETHYSTTIVVPESMDSMIENYCAVRGIKYSKAKIQK